MMPSEIDFYKAELALNGFSNAGDAQSNYKNGLEIQLNGGVKTSRA